MSNIQNKIIRLVNFNKHKYTKREYTIIPIVGYLKLNRNQFVYNTTTLKYMQEKFLEEMKYKKENYKMKTKLSIKQNKNNENKNNGVLYEVLANIKRSHSRSIICE